MELSKCDKERGGTCAGVKSWGWLAPDSHAARFRRCCISLCLAPHTPERLKSSASKLAPDEVLGVAGTGQPCMA